MALALSPASREFTYWLTRYRQIWRGTVVNSVVNPILFLTAVGAVLGGLVDAQNSPFLDGVPYLSFLAPGLLAAAAMQTGFTEGGPAVLMSTGRQGNYQSAAATPMRPGDILAGHLMFVTFRIATTMVAFAVVIAAFGAVGWGRAALMVGPAVLTGLAFATPMMAWAVTLAKLPVLAGFYRFVIMPLYMFSGTFFAVAQLPGWLRPVAYLSPLWHGVELCRTVGLGTVTLSGAAIHVAYLTAIAVAGIAVAGRTYRRRLHT